MSRVETDRAFSKLQLIEMGNFILIMDIKKGTCQRVHPARTVSLSQWGLFYPETLQHLLSNTRWKTEPGAQRSASPGGEESDVQFLHA